MILSACVSWCIILVSIYKLTGEGGHSGQKNQALHTAQMCAISLWYSVFSNPNVENSRKNANTQKHFFGVDFNFVMLWKWTKRSFFHIKLIFWKSKNFLYKTYFSLIVEHILMSFWRVYFSELPLLKLREV